MLTIVCVYHEACMFCRLIFEITSFKIALFSKFNKVKSDLKNIYKYDP